MPNVRDVAKLAGANGNANGNENEMINNNNGIEMMNLQQHKNDDLNKNGGENEVNILFNDGENGEMIEINNNNDKKTKANVDGEQFES